jgi:aminoglycoside phosphotransferase (APT) family kinase protein
MSAEDILPVLAPVLGDDIALQTWRCEIRELGYRPHNRAVLHYSAHGPNRGDRREFIGKIHRKTSRAAKAFANHSQIHASAADGGLIVPEPIMFVEDLNLMIMERVQGALLHDMLLAPSEANPAGETLRIAARALASYHALPYQGRDARPLARRLKRMRQRVAALHAVDAELAPSYEPLLDRIERRAAACDVVSTCLIHGDFTPHQLILTDRGTALVDFDGVGLGDPAIDVGSFMAKCRTMERLQGKDGASWTAEKFLGEYLALTNSDAELAERARICCAWKLISNAVHEYFKAPRRHAHASRSSLHTILLEEVAACLAS